MKPKRKLMPVMANAELTRAVKAGFKGKRKDLKRALELEFKPERENHFPRFFADT
jgi:hypothetical protein